MTASVAVVIGCFNRARYLARTVESVDRQTHRAIELVLVEASNFDERARQVTDRLVRRPGVNLVRAASHRPGAVWNAGIHASISPYVVCVDEGDALEHGYLERACSRLTDNVDFVAGWVRHVVESSVIQLCVPSSLDVGAAARDPFALPVSPLLHRSAVSEDGGFDETLLALEDYEFWLRAFARECRGLVLDEVVLERERRNDSRGRTALDPSIRSAAMAAIFSKHRDAFERETVAVLGARERLFHELLARHKELVERRDRGVAELERLDTEIERLSAEISEGGGEGIDWGELRRTSPLCRNWGYERGKPLDRYYIERFIALHSRDVSGTVLEVQENDLTTAYGSARVERSDVVDFDPAQPGATIVTDLRTAENIPSDTYDCIILTQTLHVIDDMRAVLGQCRRILKPGGVLLATLPCASRVCLEYGRGGDYWRVTEAGAERLFSDHFAPWELQTCSYGNVLAATAFLYGAAAHELTEEELDTVDLYYPLLVGVRAVKTASPVLHPLPTPARQAPRRHGLHTGAILLYHRVAEARPDTHGLCIRHADFADHMRHLRRNYQTISLEELIAATQSRDVPERAVAVTLDDGYLDNLLTASPVLVDLGIPATFFVTSDGLDDSREFWWDTLERIFLCDAQIPGTLDRTVAGIPSALATRTPDERMNAHGILYKALFDSTKETRDALLSRVLDWSGLRLPVRPGYRPMLKEEVIRLSGRPGHVIGAHGASHLSLPAQTPEIRKREIVESKHALERILGRSVHAFAYPFGHYDEATVDTVRDAGFLAAVTCDHAGVGCDGDSFRLPRLDVGRAPLARFEALLASVLRP